MEIPKNDRQFVPEKINKEATDSELAMFFIKHIENPCEVETASKGTVNIRSFYIEEAKKVLPKMTNIYAKEALELKIREYQK